MANRNIPSCAINSENCAREQAMSCSLDSAYCMANRNVPYCAINGVNCQGARGQAMNCGLDGAYCMDNRNLPFCEINSENCQGVRGQSMSCSLDGAYCMANRNEPNCEITVDNCLREPEAQVCMKIFTPHEAGLPSNKYGDSFRSCGGTEADSESGILYLRSGFSQELPFMGGDPSSGVITGLVVDGGSRDILGPPIGSPDAANVELGVSIDANDRILVTSAVITDNIGASNVSTITVFAMTASFGGALLSGTGNIAVRTLLPRGVSVSHDGTSNTVTLVSIFVQRTDNVSLTPPRLQIFSQTVGADTLYYLGLRLEDINSAYDCTERGLGEAHFLFPAPPGRDFASHYIASDDDNIFAYSDVLRGHTLGGASWSHDNFYFHHSNDLRDMHAEFRAEPVRIGNWMLLGDSGVMMENGGETQSYYGKTTALYAFPDFHVQGDRAIAEASPSQLGLYGSMSSGSVRSERYKDARLSGFSAGGYASRMLRHDDHYKVNITRPFMTEEVESWQLGMDAALGGLDNGVSLRYYRNLTGVAGGVMGASAQWQIRF